MDTNADGVVSLTEFTAACQRIAFGGDIASVFNALALHGRIHPDTLESGLSSQLQGQLRQGRVDPGQCDFNCEWSLGGKPRHCQHPRHPPGCCSREDSPDSGVRRNLGEAWLLSKEKEEVQMLSASETLGESRFATCARQGARLAGAIADVQRPASPGAVPLPFKLMTVGTQKSW